MQQETTIINADELFGNFSDTGKFQDCRDGFEKYWKWPDEIGNGFMYTIKLRPGLILGIGNYRLIENIALSFEFKYSPVVLGFSITGNVSYTINSEEGQKDLWYFKAGHSVITYLPEWQGIAEYPARTPLRTVGIYIDPVLLNTLMEGQHDKIPTGMYDIVNGANEKHYYHALNTTPAVNMAIHQILDCPYRGPLKRLYLESKTLELITYSMAQFVLPETAFKKASVLRPSDIERVREARNVLISSLDNPPSLLELARQAGINKDKLNHGFHQIFGTSVFDYLRINRLERARELLESKKMNVTEVSFEVGYAHQRNLTRAFKRHFGTNPKDHLR